MEEDDDVYAFTEKGLYLAMQIHQDVLNGFTIEQVAAWNDYDPDEIRIILAMFYQAADMVGVDLGVHVPDTIEGLDLDNPPGS